MFLTLNQKQKLATQFAPLTEIPVGRAGNALLNQNAMACVRRFEFSCGRRK